MFHLADLPFSLPHRAEQKYLKQYRWSSLPGYIHSRKKQDFIEYEAVLEEYGGVLSG